MAVNEVRGLLVAAFPEAQRDGLIWHVFKAPDGFVIQARPAVNPMVARFGPPLLSATVKVDENDQIAEVRTGGTLVANVRQKVAHAVGRSAFEVDALLETARAALPPSDSSSDVKVVPAGVKRVLEGTVVGVTFRLGQSDAPAEALTWVVDIERSSDGGSFRAAFEPVEGRLLSVVRQ